MVSRVHLTLAMILALCASPFPANAGGSRMWHPDDLAVPVEASKPSLPTPPRAAAPRPLIPKLSDRRTEAVAPCTGDCKSGKVTYKHLPEKRYYPTKVFFDKRKRKGVRDWAPRCLAFFMNEKAEYQPVGQALADSMMSKPYKDAYLRESSFVELCPRYHYLSPAQRIQAWVWFWMVLANEESNCNPQQLHLTHDKYGNRINRVLGWGMFTAEKKPDDRNWRGPKCQGDITDPILQARCAVETMYSFQLKKNKSVIDRRSTYFGPVQRWESQIEPHMKGFKSCY